MAANPDVTAAARDIAAALANNNIPYAVVGGGACRLLGGRRNTHDVDIVVPKNAVAATKNVLKNDPSRRFTVQSGTRYTFHAATNVEVDVLAPPSTFKEAFDQNTPMQVIQGVRVLPPLALLNAKVGSILNRPSQAKKESDAQDIMFLLAYCTDRRLRITTKNVPNFSDPRLIDAIVASQFVPRAHWERAGYNFTTSYKEAPETIILASPHFPRKPQESLSEQSVFLANSAVMTTSDTWDPCEVLSAHRIPYTHWYEWALRHHGSATVNFHQYLLVNSINEAEACLRAARWKSAEMGPYAHQYYDPAIDHPVVLAPTEHKDVTEVVVLLSAAAWPGVPLDKSPTDAHYPPLPHLYSALAHRFLDTDCEDFRQYLSLQLSYLYGDCPALASPGFVPEIAQDIRQFHLDWLEGSLIMKAQETVEHERAIRDRIRNGDWELMHQGTAELGGKKYDRELEARALAALNAAREKRFAEMSLAEETSASEDAIEDEEDSAL